MSEEKIRKAWYKRWWAIAIFIIVGLSFLGNILGSNDSSSSPSSDSDISSNPVEPVTKKSSSPSPQKTETTKTYSIGDSIQAGDFRWKISKYSTASEIGEDLAGTFFGAKADGMFIIVDVEVENTGKSAKYLMDSYLKLVDDQGREFSPDSATAFYLKPQGSALVFEQVNPGITKKGKIVFDVPDGLKVADIKISSNLVSNSFYTLKLIS